MKRTAERHRPDILRSDEDVAMDVRHRYAYSVVEDFARAGDRLLDVGSGEGYGASIVKRWVGSYCGIDTSAEAVAHATGRYGDADVRFDHYDGGRLPYPDSAFDIVTSFQVIEHVRDVGPFVRELRRVANPEGTILITTPNRLLRLADGERPWNRYHVREYDAAGLRDELASAFSTVEVFGIRGSASMEELERRRIAHARRLAQIDRLGLRYVLPERVDAALRQLLRRRRSPSGAHGQRLADMWRTRDDLGVALDLLAVARP